MELKAYLSDNGFTVRKFSEKSQIPEETLQKYIYKVRIPNKQNMRIIFDVTSGAVQPNDFYDVGVQ